MNSNHPSLEVALNIEVESEKVEPKEYESSSKIYTHEILFDAIVKESLAIVEDLLKMEDWNLNQSIRALTIFLGPLP